MDVSMDHMSNFSGYAPHFQIDPYDTRKGMAFSNWGGVFMYMGVFDTHDV